MRIFLLGCHGLPSLKMGLVFFFSLSSPERNCKSCAVTLQFHSTTEVINIISQFLTFVTGSPSFPRLCPIFKIETAL